MSPDRIRLAASRDQPELTAGPMSLAPIEVGAFGLILVVCVITLPAVISHIRGRSRRIDEAAALMATTAHYRARIAGGIHLTWANLFFASVGVLAGNAGMEIVSRTSGGGLLLAMAADPSIFAVGRPVWLVPARYRKNLRPYSRHLTGCDI